MKNKKSLVSLICIFSILLVGCNISNNPSNNINNNSSISSSKTSNYTSNKHSYLDDYKQYFYTKNTPITYTGSAETGHKITFNNIESLNDYTIYTYDGLMNDGYGQDIRGKRTFTAKYKVTNDMVIESINNNDYISKNKDTLHSFIKDFVVLKGQIKKNNSWTQKTIIDGVEYEAITTITEKNDTSFTTETVIKALSFENGKYYTETRTYELGKGLIYFSYLNNPYLEISYSLI
ncbi:hypothetical protein [Clostridium sp. ATCC 25772]|uniref:hypothetical protein n=1 Tax=Clostridium sp. ATCC 25772 TaxID=1676991 RepID=UPI000783F997|nr:hypothetical protein [Clostridium sp. ATCC 25772]